MATETTQDATKAPAAEAKKKNAPKGKPGRPKAKRAAMPSKAKKSGKTPANSAPKAKARRKHSTPAKRAKIIAAADREGLTALEVQKRFGVKPVTYYSWRKAAKKVGGNAKPATRAALAGLDLAGQIRQALRAQIAEMLPAMIQAEVASAIGGATPRRWSKR